MGGKNKKKNTPISSGKKDTPISSGKKYTPASSGKKPVASPLASATASFADSLSVIKTRQRSGYDPKRELTPIPFPIARTMQTISPEIMAKVQSARKRRRNFSSRSENSPPLRRPKGSPTT